MTYQDDIPGSEPVEATQLLARRFGQLGKGWGDVLQAWNDVVGPELARHAVPTSLRDGVLRVACAHATWTSELQHMAPDLVARLRGPMGDRAPSSLRCYTRSQMPTPSVAQEPSPPPELPPLAARDEAQVRQVAEQLSDPVLRDRVGRAMRASKRATQGP